KDPASGEESTSWKAFQFKTEDNPHLTDNEIGEMKGALSKDAILQELEASFEATGGVVFTMDMFPIVPWEQKNGAVVIAVDLAGFAKGDGRKGSVSILDDHAIAIVLIHETGWHILEVQHGKWDVRETALKIIKAWRSNGKPEVGIEKGMAKNAVCGADGYSGYLGELMRKWGYFTVKPLTHGNLRKRDRIKWALQGRAEKGQITLEPDETLPGEQKWVGKFLSQAVDFPNPLAKDDLLDAVSYIDQMTNTASDWSKLKLYDDWTAHDEEVGY
ncbi:MAG: hypothetical protein V3T23_08210, partial [Nitrososphaerales archaeon]